jgi:hypothetical protein
MKTPPGTFRIAFVTACGIAVALCIRAVATPTPTPTPTAGDDLPMPECGNEKFVLRIKDRQPLKAKSASTDDVIAAEVNFVALMCSAPYANPKKNRIHFRHLMHTTDSKQVHFLPDDCSQFPRMAPSSQGAELKIKTDKVTVSEAAKAFGELELTPISQHVTQQIAVQESKDVKAVVDSLAP